MAFNGGRLITVGFDKKFGQTDAGGKWFVRGGPAFPAPDSEHNTKKAAVNAARRLANKGDTVKVLNKDGSMSRKFSPD